MSKVIIRQLGNRTYKAKDVVMSWEAYTAFAKQVPGEGVTWKAILI